MGVIACYFKLEISWWYGALEEVLQRESDSIVSPWGH